MLESVKNCACAVWSPPPAEDQYTKERLCYFLKPEGIFRIIYITASILIIFLCFPLYEQPSMIGFLLYEQLFCFTLVISCFILISFRVAGLFSDKNAYFKADLVVQIVFSLLNFANLIVWLVYTVLLSRYHREAKGVGFRRYDEIALTNLFFTIIQIVCAIYFVVLDVYVISRRLKIQKVAE